jgi:hypothetical protein
MKTKTKILVASLAFSLAGAGCVPVALTAAGVGMATGVGHTLGGMVYKTFTTPQANVKKATYSALGRMQIKVVKAKREGTTEVITAKAADREIDIELEALHAEYDAHAGRRQEGRRRASRQRDGDRDHPADGKTGRQT